MSEDLPLPEPRLIAIFASDGAATLAASRLGVRLLRLAAPGVALLAADPGMSTRLYAAGARLVIA